MFPKTRRVLLLQAHAVGMVSVVLYCLFGSQLGMSRH